MTDTAAPARPTFTFTFRPEGSIWHHRDVVAWLDDLLRVAGRDMSTTHVDFDHEDRTGTAVVVSGDEGTLRLACVALNLHAEQTPWDTTPPEQATALDALLARA